MNQDGKKKTGKKQRKPVELLAPAGSIECMEAAVQNGADAVYMGGPRFGARAYAENPETDGLIRALDYVHMQGKKLYLTVNTLLKPEELSGLYDYLLPFYEAGLDAVLVQDLGVLRQIRRDFPDLPVHASTQMTVMDADGARALQQLGLTRVVTAREITLPEMKAITDTGMELEVFVHGAICYCYSGQCLLSSLIGGRSGNRGRCAQPCRLPYDVIQDGRILTKKDQNYVLNLKDMDTLSCLPQILDAGVASLKIEGRMKSPRYTGGVTAVYRKYIDRCLAGGDYRVDADDRRFLKELFDRGGYTEYASEGLRDGMVAVGRKPDFRAADEAFLKEKKDSFPSEISKEKIKGKLRFYTGEPVILTMESTRTAAGEEGCQDTVTEERVLSATGTGAVVQPAQNRPMDEEALRKRFDKLGDTPFEWESLEIETDGAGFLPVGQLNELRRNTAETLRREILSRYRRTALPKSGKETSGEETADKEIIGPETVGNPGRPEIRLAVDTLSQLRTAVAYSGLSRIYLNLSTITEEEEAEAFGILRRWQESQASGAAFYLNLPPVLRSHMKQRLERRLELYAESGAEGFLVHTWDQSAWLAERMPRMKRQADASLYTYNSQAAQTLAEAGAAGAVLPLELNVRELARRMSDSPLPAELIVYGYLPVMVSAQCIRRTTEGCDGCPGIMKLQDRKKQQFAVRNCCRYCFNVIYNSEPLFLLDCGQEWKSLGVQALRLQFTIENEKEMRRILDSCLPDLEAGRPVANPLKSFTRGHFRRGVE